MSAIAKVVSSRSADADGATDELSLDEITGEDATRTPPPVRRSNGIVAEAPSRNGGARALHNDCDGVVECTALVLAEGCTELDRPAHPLRGARRDPALRRGETSFVVYTKFEGCEHATDDGSAGPGS